MAPSTTDASQPLCSSTDCRHYWEQVPVGAACTPATLATRAEGVPSTLQSPPGHQCRGPRRLSEPRRVARVPCGGLRQYKAAARAHCCHRLHLLPLHRPSVRLTLPPRPVAMASAAAISTLLRPPRVHPCPVASASPLPMHVLRRRPRSLTTAYAVQTQEAAVQTRGAVPVRRGTIQRWTRAPVTAIGPATEDESVFLITLDLSGAPALVDAYTTPGQYLLTRVPVGEKRHPAPMVISSAPRSGLQFDLLVRSVPGTTSELLCQLHVGDVVELGPITGPGFAIQNINPPAAAETMLLFAVDVGISPFRSLIEYGFAASERENVRLYYTAKDLTSMPYKDRFNKWEKTGVKVVPITQKIPEYSFLEYNLQEIVINPLSTGAVIVAPQIVKQIISAVLLDFGVPVDKILTIDWYPEDPFAPNV